MQLERTLSEAITLLEFLHEDTKPQLYPIDLCELLQQVAAQSDMIRAQLGWISGWITAGVLPAA